MSQLAIKNGNKLAAVHSVKQMSGPYSKKKKKKRKKGAKPYIKLVSLNL